MTRRDRYLLREFAVPFVAGLVLAVLLIEVLQIQRELSGMGASGIGLPELLRRSWSSLPRIATMALPVATALGVSLAVNRLARDNEVVVMRGTGARLFRLFLPLTVVGVVLAGANVVLTEMVVPHLARRQEMGPGLGTGFALGAGVLPDTRSRVLVAFAGAQSDAQGDPRLGGVALVAPDRVVTARLATYRGGVLRMEDAIVHRFDAEGFTAQEQAAARLDERVSLGFVPQGGLYSGTFSEETFSELGRRSRAAAQQGDRARYLAAETARWFRIALPTLCAAFALCAAPLALRFSRAGGFAGVLLSVVTVFVAWNTHLFFQAVALGGWIPPVVCAFVTHVLLTTVGVGLLVRLER